MVLLVFSACSDALGQLHFGFGCWDVFVSLGVILGRGPGHTPGGRCLWGCEWLRTSKTWVVRAMTRVEEVVVGKQGALECVLVGIFTDSWADKGCAESLES
jgi:hypothetical protein